MCSIMLLTNRLWRARNNVRTTEARNRKTLPSCVYNIQWHAFITQTNEPCRHRPTRWVTAEGSALEIAWLDYKRAEPLDRRSPSHSPSGGVCPGCLELCKSRPCGGPLQTWRTPAAQVLWAQSRLQNPLNAAWSLVSVWLSGFAPTNG